VEQHCHHCNAAVPEGSPFCAACGAPQIRVSSPESTVPVTSAEVSVPPLPASGGRTGIDWQIALRKCLIAAAVMAFLLAIPFLPLLGIFIIPAGGWLAVYLYTRNPALGMDAGRGARLGAVTGVFGFVFGMVRSAIKIALQRGQMMSEFKRGLEDAARQNPDPKVQEVMQKLMTPEGLAIIITLVIIVVFFFYLIMTTIGGAIGGATAKRGETP